MHRPNQNTIAKRGGLTYAGMTDGKCTDTMLLASDTLTMGTAVRILLLVPVVRVK